MNRRLQREHIFKIIFSYEFDIKEDFYLHVNYYMDEVESEDLAGLEYIRNKALRIIEMVGDIDQRILEKTKDWTFERIAKVEVAIIRLAVYEIYHDEDIPSSVAINEAVELAKKYGGDNSPSFVNGVLANIVK